MWRAEWTITAPSGAPFGPTEISIFLSEHCKENATFSGTRHRRIRPIETSHISIIYWQTLQILQVQPATPNFHSNSVSALCEGWIQCISSVMHCKSSHCKITAAKIGHYILPESEKLKPDQFHSTKVRLLWSWVVWVVGPNLKIRKGSVQVKKCIPAIDRRQQSDTRHQSDMCRRHHILV